MRTQLLWVAWSLTLLLASTAHSQTFLQSPTAELDERSQRTSLDDVVYGSPFYLYGGPGSLLGKFQSGPLPTSPSDAQGWTGVDNSGAGDFSKFFRGMTDTDSCLDNASGVVGFYDVLHTDINWSYGVPGGFVLPYTLTPAIHNEVHSPIIDWDLPGFADDNYDIVGMRLRFRVWKHLPFENGIGYYWKVRMFDSVSWTPWRNNGTVEYGSDLGVWVDEVHDLTHLFAFYDADFPFTQVQIALGVVDLSGSLGLPGTGATISPVFDDVVLEKFEVGGAILRAEDIDLFHDAFPQSGLIAASTAAERDLLDVRIDAGRDPTPAMPFYSAQDGMHVLVRSPIVGVTLDPLDIRLRAALHTNPYFEDGLRGNLTSHPTFTESLGTGIDGWDVWTGTEVGTAAVDGLGNPIADTFAFDLPDVDFMYPGDVLQFYVEAVDDIGTVHTIPGDLYGFAGTSRGAYNEVFSMHALPTITANGQPEILVANQNGHRGHQDSHAIALANNGFAHGIDYDRFTTRGPEYVQSNSIGSAGTWGATPSQLANYEAILYLAGNLDRNVLSGGAASNLWETKADDIGLLSDWNNQFADRLALYFGDDIAAVPSRHASGPAFLTTHMGVTYDSDSVGHATQTPCVLATAFPFSVDLAIGPCRINADHDAVTPIAPAYAGQSFQDGANCWAGPDEAAVYLDQIVGGFRKVGATHVYQLSTVLDPVFPKFQTSAGKLLADHLFSYGLVGSIVATTTPAVDTGAQVRAFPNPANPQASIVVQLPRAGSAEVGVYDLRGRKVRELWSGRLARGESRFSWDGVDDRGRGAASGVYVVRLATAGGVVREKLALLK